MSSRNVLWVSHVKQNEILSAIDATKRWYILHIRSNTLHQTVVCVCEVNLTIKLVFCQKRQIDIPKLVWQKTVKQRWLLVKENHKHFQTTDFFQLSAHACTYWKLRSHSLRPKTKSVHGLLTALSLFWHIVIDSLIGIISSGLYIRKTNLANLFPLTFHNTDGRFQIEAKHSWWTRTVFRGNSTAVNTFPTTDTQMQILYEWLYSCFYYCIILHKFVHKPWAIGIIAKEENKEWESLKEKKQCAEFTVHRGSSILYVIDHPSRQSFFYVLD